MSNMFLHFAQHIDFIREKGISRCSGSWNSLTIETFLQLTKRNASVGTRFVEASDFAPYLFLNAWAPWPRTFRASQSPQSAQTCRGRYDLFRCRLLQKTGCLPLLKDIVGVS